MKPDDGLDDIWLSTCHFLSEWFMTYATDLVDPSHHETGVTYYCVTVFGGYFGSCLSIMYCNDDASCEATWRNILCRWFTAVDDASDLVFQPCRIFARHAKMSYSYVIYAAWCRPVPSCGVRLSVWPGGCLACLRIVLKLVKIFSNFFHQRVDAPL